MGLTVSGIRESAGSQLAGREMLRGVVGNASVYRHEVGEGVLSKIKEDFPRPGQLCGMRKLPGFCWFFSFFLVFCFLCITQITSLVQNRKFQTDF